MHRARKARIADLNQHLTCKLCKGYFIDATTIIECLHSFCRSCIVKYLQSNKYCPICDVQVHKNKPFLNIRPDKTLQDIVYKLVPRLLQNELQRRQDFFLAHPETKPSLDQMHETHQHLFTSDESVSLTLSYHGCKKSARYLQCPSAVSVGHLQKLIRAKYDLLDDHRVEILYNQDCLNPPLTLMDIAYIYSWKRKAPMELTYRIYQQAKAKKIKVDVKPEAEAETVVASANNNNNWKEVQLRISENGEMSITGIQDEEEVVNNNNYKADLVTIVENAVTKKELPDLQINTTTAAANLVTSAAKIETTISANAATTATTNISCVSMSSATTKTVFSTINSSKCSVAQESRPSEKKDTENSDEGKTKNSEKIEKGVKRKLDAAQNNDQPPKKEKQTILNHAISSVQNLSNNHPLKKHAQLNKTSTPPEPSTSTATTTTTTVTTSTPSATTSPVITATTSTTEIFPKPSLVNTTPRNFHPPVILNRPGTPKPPSKPCYMPKPVINIPKPSPSTSKQPEKPSPKIESKPNLHTSQAQNLNKMAVKSKASTPIGYKTLRDPPKSWNSQIAKANINKPAPDPKYNDLKNVRPAKFFKMRNNLPRYLGNPASGVKPMYQVHVSPEKDKDNKEKEKQEQVSTSTSSASSSSCSVNNSNNGKGEIKKHSIVKIDPKTLKPISEKAPETTSLSNSSSDLKINTSSVSIFNPLKLQNSPKSERKSPKSPKSSSPTTKRDKLNLNFTPSNPFIPNLASPTVSPNQFLYSGPPGFPPPYDPRVMAAYHSLFYGQRMAFPPSLSLDLNQRKGFELTGPPSPKIGGLAQSHNPQQIQHKLPGSELSQQSSSRNNVFSKPQMSVKKSSKESSSKSEKSLQIAVEKLTQNRVKEIKNETKANSIKASGTPKASSEVAAKEKETKEVEKAAQSEGKVEESNNEKCVKADS